MEKEQRDELIARGTQLKEEVQALDVKLSALENALQFEGQRLPNLTHPDVPFGNEDENAVELKVIGSQPQFDFEVRFGGLRTQRGDSTEEGMHNASRRKGRTK